MRIVDCTKARHAEAILAILNDAILHSTALYEYTARPASSMGPWFDAKAAQRLPVLGAEDAHGSLLGFATYGPFRAFPAYKYTAELSLYVERDRRRSGVGSALLEALIATASARDLHLLVAAIDATNLASIALHEKHGFVHAGTVRGCGFKFGRWLDLALYQRALPGPTDPRDG